MTTDIVMPNMGFDTQEGKLVEWLKQPGDTVSRGEPIAIIESDKANVELESVAGGLLLEWLVAEGEDVDVGAVIARVGQEDDNEVADFTPHTLVAATHDARGRIEASPIAKRLASEHQIDLANIQGSGPRGRVKRRDIEAYLARPDTATASVQNASFLALPKVRREAREAGIDLLKVPPTGSRGDITLADLKAFQAQLTTPIQVSPGGSAPVPEGAHVVPLSRTRQIIGQRLGASKREAPHFYVSGEFDLETALARLNSLARPQPRLNDLIQYLTVQTLVQVPELNATFVDGRLYQHESVNLAIAVAREDGLITPVIHKADRYSLAGLAAESRELIERTRINLFSPMDLQNGTFTISNLGVIKQVDQFTAVINPPQVAILAVGTVKQRPIVINGGLHIRHTVHLTLSGDHRAIDGMHLGHFMAAFQENLNNFSQG